jgi:group I intron endonuclease
MNIGIYCIQNSLDSKSYIGSSVNIIARWKEHKRYLRRNIHENSYLQNAVNKYGMKNFEFKILEECSKEKLLEREQYYLDLYKSYDSKFGYNICKVAGNGSQLGLKRSLETRQLMSLAKKGKPSNVQGYRFTEQQRKQLSLSHKDLQGNNLGRKFTKTWCKNLSISHKKNIEGVERCRRMGQMNKGKKGTVLGKRLNKVTRKYA